MTDAEIRDLRKEINRLEDLQIDIALDKKGINYAKANHNKLAKLRRMLSDAKRLK